MGSYGTCTCLNLIEMPRMTRRSKQTTSATITSQESSHCIIRCNKLAKFTTSPIGIYQLMMMVASKAWIRMKQYMKDKACMWAYKFFIVADSLNGYPYHLYIYAGKRDTATNRGLSFDIVDILMHPLPKFGYNPLHQQLLLQP